VPAADRDPRAEEGDVAEPVDPSLESRWRAWAQGSLGGSPGQVDAAVAAAVGVVTEGGRQTDAIGAAKRAWEASAPVAAAPTPVATPPAPDPGPSVAQRSAPPARLDWVQGRVRGFRTRIQQKTQTYWVPGQFGRPGMHRTRRIQLTVWTFYVDAPGAGGPVAVEMKGTKFKGVVSDGDEIRIEREPKPGKTLRINRLQNLSTGEAVRAKGGPPVGTAKVIVTAIQIAMFAVIIVFVLTIVIPHLKN
jgi:hypothetical protein